MTDAESTPTTGIRELIINDGDDGTYATLNNAALVISGDRVAWTGPASRAPAADRADRTDLTNTPSWGTVSHRSGHSERWIVGLMIWLGRPTGYI